MRVLMVAAILLTLPAAASAQERVRFDQASGDVFLRVVLDDSTFAEVRVEPANKVRLTVDVSIEPGSSRAFRYRYIGRIQPESPRGLMALEVNCLSTGDYVNLAAEADYGTERLDWITLTTSYPGRFSCSFEGGAADLRGGGVFDASLETDLLPAVGELRAVGAHRSVAWPTFDPIPENQWAEEIADNISGITGGWRSLQGLTPTREPAAMDDPIRAVDTVAVDLGRACEALRWISHRGVCRSLQAKLDAAARALERGQTEAARGPLASFLQELDAQHGPEPGKHVSDNAYWLLRINVEYLLGGI